MDEPTTGTGWGLFLEEQDRLKHELYVATRLLANEQAVARALRRHIIDCPDDLYTVHSDLYPTVIVNDDRVREAFALITTAAAQ